MKLYLHYTIWNKAAHVPWLCEGIRTAIPKDSKIDFVLDNCTDDTEKNLATMMNVSGYGSLVGYNVQVHKSSTPYRWPNTNKAIKRFLESDCTHFLSPQDDQQIKDKFIVRNLEDLYLNERVGMVGMRDGIDFNGDYFSSMFSDAGQNVRWLVAGEYMKVRYVNDGPICLSRDVIESVGLFDTEFIAHYADNDYSFRCLRSGFENYVMGAEIVHEKWGCKVCGEIQPSQVWLKEIAEHDYERYKKKWLI